jgi:hypothetical protein
MPHRVPFKFVNTVDEALVLLKPHLSQATGGTEALRRALAEMREQLTARGATVAPGSIS